MGTVTYDYIIVGAGSAGCVLANRLSTNPDVSVLLLEAGPRDNSWQISMPLGFVSTLQCNRFNWNYHSEPEIHLAHRRAHCPAGRVLGGSSSINGMVHVRANAGDFLRWQQLGAKSWTPELAVAYAKKSETYLGKASLHRGDSGPLKIAPATAVHPLDRAFIDAGGHLGMANDRDFNSQQQEGFGCYDQAIVRGERFNSARAYLRPIRHRANLTVRTAARVSRVLFDNHRAIGVEWWQHGQRTRVSCRGEVVLSAGALGSPHLLHLSGVGDGQSLRKLGIPVQHHLPSVGQGLQNHIEAVVQYRCTRPVTMAPYTRSIGKVVSGARWFLDRGGICASNHWHTGAFLRTEGAPYPDIQMIFCPISLTHGTLNATPWHGFQIHAGFQKPTSRGRVCFVDSDPLSPPQIQLNLLSTSQDKRGLRTAIRLAREIASGASFNPFRGEEVLPGKSVRTDQAIDKWITHYAENSYHLTSSCRMGAEDSNDSVVNEFCQVIGIDGLRVVDASVMPEIVNANPHATVVLVAERVADLIGSVQA